MVIKFVWSVIKEFSGVDDRLVNMVVESNFIKKFISVGMHATPFPAYNNIFSYYQYNQ